MGGSLTVESEVGRGTRFSFTIRVEPCLGAPSGRGGAAASSPTQSMPLPTEPANPIPAGSIRPRLDRLEEQLASNMLDAQQLAHDIEATLAASGHGSAFAPIMEAIQQLRFREARAALAKFRSSLSA